MLKCCCIRLTFLVTGDGLFKNIFLIESGFSFLNIEDIIPILLFSKINIVLKIQKPSKKVYLKYEEGKYFFPLTLMKLFFLLAE